MLRRVADADQLPDYDGADRDDGRSLAVLFRLCGQTEALALAERMHAE
jgi:hypothetical protein